MTQVFLSWSGELSRSIAEELRKWIPGVLQFAKPYFTPSDIEKGTKWSAEISKKLSESQIGIICLTKENFERPWILFEAGALSKGLDNTKVCSVLFGLDDTDLSGPLTTFQATKFDKSDFKKLMLSINESGGDNKLAKDTFDEVFEMWWPRLETAITKAIEHDGKKTDKSIRSDRDILEEILSLGRLSARRTSTSKTIPDMSEGFLMHLLDIGTSVMREATNYSDRDLQRAARELLEASTYMASRISIRHEGWPEKVAELERMILEFDADKPRRSEMDDEIPF